MKTYLFSICIRGFIALSGFLVFIITAQFFGAEGRGAIAYGTSLFAAISILLSFNLGRVFLSRTLKNDESKKEALPTFLLINFVLSLVAMFIGVIYWMFSSSAQSVLNLSQILGFSLLSFFYVWFHNGHPLFSSFSQTKLQDMIIFCSRMVLLLFLLLVWIFKTNNLTLFIWGYAFILFCASFTEIFFLYRIIKKPASKKLVSFEHWQGILVSSWWPHFDYVIFNIFPLVLTVVSAAYLSKTELGRYNFAIQVVNLIFLLSTTANMRIANYVSSVGFRERLLQLKKLFWFTTLISAASVFLIYFALSFITSHNSFVSFAGAESLFLVAALSIPGYLSYQFLNPIWIELQKLKLSAQFSFLSAVISFSLYPLCLKYFNGVTGLVYIFTLFYLLILCGNLFMFVRYVYRPGIKDGL